MPTTAQDIWDLLPGDHRVGEVEVVGVEVVDDRDSAGDDAVRVVFTLADPPGRTWPTYDTGSLRALVQRGRVRAGEDRLVLFSLRAVSELDDPGVDDDPEPVWLPGQLPRPAG